ncbi:MAG: type II secretion system protein [Candidatus Brennerbacteria bacterium]|nr:type II secretion system protein [Candidatus Brennerbacteria bacterium]
MEIRKGFTLIELLVVIAILAILATITVVVLNPAELLKQARDSTRISELASLRSAISLYLASQTSDLTAATLRCTAGICAGGTSSTITTVAGGGWVNVNFTLIPGGSPLAALPLDPVNSATYFYGYSASSTNNLFELNANMESVRYASGSAESVEANTADGGDQSGCYEIGTNVNLITAQCPY